ncbi:MAG: hypothetical protein J0G94_02370 [Sphingomonadales bacterium]|nr:hypothetical protein [Sphingomonadales bacterium]
MSAIRLSSLPLLLAALGSAIPALAQPGWGGRWGEPREEAWPAGRPVSNGRDAREGKIDAAHFVADDAGDALGKGPVAVTHLPGTAADPGDQAVYEAALIDQLVKAGYDTMKPDPSGGQVLELRIARDVLLPEETRRKPVSGEATVGVSNRGSMMGMAVAIDLSKPKKALVSTRMEARLIDRASGKPLWEGRAEMATREGDSHWTQQAIAARLASAMFEDFPGKADRGLASR